MIQFFALRTVASPDPARAAAFTRDVEWIGNRILTSAAGLAALSGVLMVIDHEGLGFGDDWILIGIGLFAVTFLGGALFFGPESGRIGKLIESEGPSSPAVRARIQRILALSRADLMLLFLIIFDMSVKPSLGDATLWIAVLVFAALAVVLVRHGLKTQVGGATAAAE
jgi:uncharacterized membrane protein